MIYIIGGATLILVTLYFIHIGVSFSKWSRTEAKNYYNKIHSQLKGVKDKSLKFIDGESDYGPFTIEVIKGKEACHTVSIFSDSTGTLRVNRDPVSSPFSVYTILHNSISSVAENEIEMFAEKLHALVQEKIDYK